LCCCFAPLPLIRAPAAQGARDAFAASLVARPWDGVAANNAAVAALYCADLPGAVTILVRGGPSGQAWEAQPLRLTRACAAQERALEAHPLAALHEPLVLNLCSLCVHCPRVALRCCRVVVAAPRCVLTPRPSLLLARSYELSVGEASLAKRRLASWLASAGPEDFDGTCTRL
jgi:hypothetical protein